MRLAWELPHHLTILQYFGNKNKVLLSHNKLQNISIYIEHFLRVGKKVFKVNKKFESFWIFILWGSFESLPFVGNIFDLDSDSRSSKFSREFSIQLFTHLYVHRTITHNHALKSLFMIDFQKIPKLIAQILFTKFKPWIQYLNIHALVCPMSNDSQSCTEKYFQSSYDWLSNEPSNLSLKTDLQSQSLNIFWLLCSLYMK